MASHHQVSTVTIPNELLDVVRGARALLAMIDECFDESVNFDPERANLKTALARLDALS